MADIGELRRLFCPLPVIVIFPVGYLQVGDAVSAEAAKITLELHDVYIIIDRVYLFVHFRIHL
jgi:hypothetical protein